ncbi:MAG: RNA polymerase sigma factor RpoD/SigA [Gemmatimonadales bacterium]
MSDGGALDRYLAEIREHPLLDREKEAGLARRAREGDEEALHLLVAANLRFVVSVARRYAHRGVPLDELVNEGNLGLIRAARRFDESHGVRFVSYAVWWIRQSILSLLARQASIVRVPSGRLDEARRVAAASRRLSQRLGRRAREDEVATELGVGLPAVRAALAARGRDVSLDAPLAANEDSTLLDTIAAPDDPSRRVHREALSDALRGGLRRLSEREAEVLRRYYGLEGREPATLAQIAEALGVSRERAGEIKRQALGRLRMGPASRRLETFRAH